jgi:hypothetical protein
VLPAGAALTSAWNDGHVAAVAPRDPSPTAGDECRRDHGHHCAAQRQPRPDRRRGMRWNARKDDGCSAMPSSSARCARRARPDLGDGPGELTRAAGLGVILARCWSWQPDLQGPWNGCLAGHQTDERLHSGTAQRSRWTVAAEDTSCTGNARRLDWLFCCPGANRTRPGTGCCSAVAGSSRLAVSWGWPGPRRPWDASTATEVVALLHGSRPPLSAPSTHSRRAGSTGRSTGNPSSEAS